MFKNKLPSALSFWFLGCLLGGLSSFPAAVFAQGDDSGWVEGDQDEVRIRPQRGNTPVRQRRAPAPPMPDQEDEEIQGVSREESRQTERDSDGQNPVSGPAPVLNIKGGTLSGGVESNSFRSSSTYRGGSRTNRGMDRLSNQFLRQAPYLDTPRTVAVQASTFKNWLDRFHAGATARLGKNTIVEVKGQWDDCAHALRNFSLPHTRIPASRLTDTDLSGTRILVVNCGCNMDAKALNRVRDFVQGGGYLLTTDWALDSCLEKAFPGYVQWNSDYTESGVVDAVVVDDDPVLLAGVPRVAYWKLENRSQTVKVLDGRAVQVLARSRMLMGRESSQVGILALTFPYGDGRILHLVGHFDNNADRASNLALPDPAPMIGIGLRQAIAANFVLAALDGDKKDDGDRQADGDK